MSKILDTILANADSHTRLLMTIDNLECVPEEKEHQVNHVKGLETILAANKDKVAQCTKETRMKKAIFESRKNSKVKRYFYNMFGKGKKFEARVERAKR